MKREVMFILILVFSIFSVSLIYADEQQQIENAYACVASKISKTGCSALSFDEKVFSVLINKTCTNALISSGSQNQCWPSSGCRVKSTAQAILALNSKIDTTNAENWLLSQTSSPTELDWFLEIEELSGTGTSCTITYSGSSYTISIRADKTINSGAGSYLALTPNKYWLRVSPSLYGKDITISCNKQFITTLLFQKKNSPTIHVSDKVTGSQAGGVTTERVDSLCFANTKNGPCDYEGSLWASLVLNSVNRDISQFIPYLIAMKDEGLNQRYIPESFLYILRGKFRTELLLKQKFGLYWEESGDRYYDTALALLPFQYGYDSANEKEKSKTWLLGVQTTTGVNAGCWNNNLVDTAFILYSIWPPSSVGICDCYAPSDGCSTVSCQAGQCIYTDVGCIDNDGCCGNGCSSANDDDCPPTPCTSANVEVDCGVNSESSPYCASDDNLYKDVTTYSCISGTCSHSTARTLVEGCADKSEICQNGECIPDPSKCTSGYVNGIFGNSCPEDMDCVGGICIPGPECTSTDTSKCSPDQCMKATCASGICQYNFVDCGINNDGCCPPGCGYLNDNDCTQPPECTSNDQCSGENYQNDPYCSGSSTVSQDIYTYTCSSNSCVENQKTVTVKTCTSKEICEGNTCVPGPECGGLFGNSCPSGYECVNEVCAPIPDCTSTDTSRCPTKTCKEPSCASGTCQYDFMACAHNDGCCNPGCNPLNDNDCLPPPECTVNEDCFQKNYEDVPYCSDDRTIVKEVHNYTCVDSSCQENIKEVKVKTCSSSEMCDIDMCITRVCTTGFFGGNSCQDGYDCVDGVCVPHPLCTATDTSDCEYKSCKEPSCAEGVCQYTFVDCGINDDGCCAPGCSYLQDTDCPLPPECITDANCSTKNYENEPYCEDDKVIFKEVYNYTCSFNSCIDNMKTVKVRTCAISEMCYYGECIPVTCSSGVSGSECPYGSTCINDVCVPNGCEVDGCPYGEVCDYDTGECVVGPECTSDYDCYPGTCNYDTGKCVDVTGCTDDYDCYPGICNYNTGECIISTGCTDDYDCNYGEYCDVNFGECVPYECSYDEDCYLGICVDGSCTSFDCEDEGYYCMSGANCENNYGNILGQEYYCDGSLFECCDTAPVIGTCADEWGEICEYGEECVGGTTITVSDTLSGETCCVGGGTCEESSGEVYCDERGGICASSCSSDEEVGSYTCYDNSEICCVKKPTPPPSHAWIWIIILLLLIGMAVAGIIFRDKLRVQWIKLKDKLMGKKGKKKFEIPTGSHIMPQRTTFPGRILPRRILPRGPGQPPQGPLFRRPGQPVSPPGRPAPHAFPPGHPQHRPPAQETHPAQKQEVKKTEETKKPEEKKKKPEEKSKGELDDVLKKLKEMGNK